MNQKARELSEDLLRTKFEQLGERERRVAHHIAERRHISRNMASHLQDQLTVGQRMADRVASFGGSWTFISIFFAFIVAWVVLNSYALMRGDKVFDPYPYILLNLFLSMLASVQAPIILMSQNRQSYKDRINAEHDYEVNLKAELEIMALHHKVDGLREKQWAELISIQQEQLRLMGEMIAEIHELHARAKRSG